MIILVLSICLAKSAGAAPAHGLRLSLWSNNARVGTPSISLIDGPIVDFSTTKAFSADIEGTIEFNESGVFEFYCNFSLTSTAFVWIDGHMICQDNNAYKVGTGLMDNPLPIQGTDIGKRSKMLPFRAHIMFNGTESLSGVSGTPSMSIKWSPWSGNKPSGPPSAIPVAMFRNELPLPEQERETLQRKLSTGWGPWLHPNMLSLVSLPSGATVTTIFCPVGKSGDADCITSALPDGHKQNAASGYVRVGHHAYDRSYVQFFVGHSCSDSLLGANISIEYSVSGGGSDIDILISPVAESTINWSQVDLVLDLRFAWLKGGSVSASSSAITLTPVGLPSITLHSTAIGKVASSSEVRLNLGAGPVGLSTISGRTVSSILSLLAEASNKEADLLKSTFGVKYASHGMAVKASIMWNLIHNPAENGAALLPVSRDWNFAPKPVSSDWTYAIFDWDNIFASLLAGLGSKAIAYSNLIQVVKSKTAAGFVPNYAAGGLKSMDRTEPPVGSKVLLELYRKYGDKWIVELLFNDLLEWSNWFMRRRLLPPLDLVALGSYNEEAAITGQFAPQNMQAARFESGLDNSPMYDGDFYDSSNTFLMQLYDVGMSSMVVQEAYALAELADAIGRPEGQMLRARGDQLSTLIAQYLWDEESANFVNKFTNNSFYRRISPTSFYALQTKAPTATQATAMVEKWLLSPNHFCIAPNGDFAGNNDTCYWGLPSIQASDVAFPPLGYWRGYVWGPMAQLTYWSLQNYDHVPAVRKGRKALVKQMGSLMMSQWNQHRHICENYNPHKYADTSGGDCSGTKFYHWGALTGFIELVEEGFWNPSGSFFV